MTTTTWRDSLLKASFRGVAFEVENTSMPAGQRGQLHEFVQRDEPHFEQLGKRAQVHKLTAFVIGPDCFERRDKLLEALEVPGAGELVHPWLGRMLVKVGACDLSHDRREGGMARFDLEMYPELPRKYPTAKVNTKQQALKASGGLLDSALGRFSSAMDKVNAARINLLSLRNSVSGVFNAVQQQFAPLMTGFNDLSGFVQMVVNAPGSLQSLFGSYLTSMTGGLFSLFSFGSSSSGGSSSGSSYRSALSLASQHVDSIKEIDTIAPAGGEDTSAAAQATANFVQDALLVQVTSLVAELPIAPKVEPVASVPAINQQVIQPTERAEVPVADDVLQLRDDLTEAIWQASLKADHNHYQALTEVRHAVSAHLTAVAESGVRLIEVTPVQSLPALVLAYRRFGDATRENEVVQRNRIRHPGFVPPLPLKVAKE
ncbi:DNA circularization protein [Pseudomonas putida]|uniref:DNA circularization protein n=1 Tax=Pseudomonas putida TaxID=303 RepID=UPI002022CF64|nr:DNA circularization N-terminal domain-containing protein [Pseudomonas putida]MCL8308932.1 DNA circularization N-terminal domain-containing protein [Pseudomonas putida]